ncbi:ABC transporter permease [Eubacterium oxidoreducens]|uniref:NitT/TauT family transport system permease protein n=1 Tax=Eubacterium oxidoreducens TaxID=1732 RepID=A0A1G6C238_EUBOX|nr:ABC transporter permease subunit [Eubacterium oxidoreducens]SDB26941.1 NitT/TauT family transport system permease protein [Eubacterium oxidoreducens]
MKGLIKSVAGLVAALLIQIFVPYVDGENLTEYPLGPIRLSGNDLYKILLIGLAIFWVILWMVSQKNKTKKKIYQKKSSRRLALGLALAAWDIAGSKFQLLPQPFFPGPAGIAQAFLEDGSAIWENTLYSVRLFAWGFILGAVIGIVTGVLIGYYAKAAYWVEPVLNICGVLPAVVWMPFALILFPTSFQAAVFLLVICVWFPVTSLSALGIMSTPKVQYEAAQMLGASKLRQIFTVAIPHALPQIFTGIITAEAFSFTNLVMAEMMGQPGGLGYYINASKAWSAYYKVFAAIVVMAIMFSLIKWGTDKLQNSLLRWQKGVVK